MKKLPTSLGPFDCANSCRNCSTTKPTDNELENGQKLCLLHEPYIMKFPEETSFRFNKYHYKILHIS